MTTPRSFGPLGDVALLRGHAPYTLAGYAGFRAVIDTDGAVPARLKALFIAVAAIDRRYPELARRELARGASLGLTVRDATAGLIVLSSLRGEGAALEFADVLLAYQGGWSKERLRKMVGGRESWVNLPKHIPIHITYFTAFVDDSGTLQTRPDIYGYNARVERALGL